MPKHLYTLPAGPALPSPVGAPEGYPFILEAGTGDALKQALYVIKNGAYAKLGGGGGAVKFGPLVTAKAGDPYLVIQADQDTSVGGAGYPTGITDDTGATQQVSVRSFDSVVPLTNPKAAPAPQYGWLLGKAYNRDAAFGDYVLSFVLPYIRSNPGKPSPGTPAMRFSFHYDPPQAAGRESYIIGLQTEAYDPANVSRVVQAWNEYENPAADGSYYGGRGDDPEDGGIIWFEGNSNSGDYSVTVPAGGNYLDFIVFQTDPTRDVPQGQPNSKIYSGVISNVTVRLLEPGEQTGTLFVEEATGRIWLYDDSVILRHPTDSTDGNGGAGWYPITPPYLHDSRGNEFEHLTEYGFRYYVGQHMFSSITDFAGNSFATAKAQKTPIPFHGTVAPVRPGAAGLADGFGFLDRFLGPDKQASGHYPLVLAGAGTPLAPVINAGSPAAYNNGSLATNTTYYYRVVAFDAFGGTLQSNEASATTVSYNAPGKTLNVSFTAILGADHYKIYRGTAPGNEVEIATVTSAAVLAYNNGNYTFTDATPLVPTSAAAPPADANYVTSLLHSGKAYALAAVTAFVRDSGQADCDLEVDFDYIYGSTGPNFTNTPLWGVRFRESGPQDYLELTLNPRAGTPTWVLSSVVAGTATQVATGSFTFIQPFSLAVQVTGDQIVAKTSDASGRLHQVLIDDITANTHTLTGLATGTRNGFLLPFGGSASYFVDHASPTPNPDGTDIKLDYNGLPKACFVVPYGLDKQSGGKLVGYTFYCVEGTNYNQLKAQMLRRKQSNYSDALSLTPVLQVLGAGFTVANNIFDDGTSHQLDAGDELDLYVNIPANYTTTAPSTLHMIWTIYMGGPNS